MNSDALDAIDRGEPICFWCTDPFWGGQTPIIIERTVCDTNGCHIEETYFHRACAVNAIRDLLTTCQKKGPFTYLPSSYDDVPDVWALLITH
jgi:hypothetical protein